MAIYHLHVQVIGRSAGRSVAAAAAYRSASVITSSYTGEAYNFSRKKYVEYSAVMLPQNAPPEYGDRQNLWDTIETLEKSRDAQLARELDVALPVELTLEQQIELVRDFVQDTFIKEGMIADINLHNPPLMDSLHRPVDDDGKPTRDYNRMTFPNPHAHIMLTLRPMDEQGHWLPKAQKEYLCKRGKEDKGNVEIVSPDGMHVSLKETDDRDNLRMLAQTYASGIINEIELTFSVPEDAAVMCSYIAGMKVAV